MWACLTKFGVLIHLKLHNLPFIRGISCFTILTLGDMVGNKFYLEENTNCGVQSHFLLHIWIEPF